MEGRREMKNLLYIILCGLLGQQGLFANQVVKPIHGAVKVSKSVQTQIQTLKADDHTTFDPRSVASLSALPKQLGISVSPLNGHFSYRYTVANLRASAEDPVFKLSYLISIEKTMTGGSKGSLQYANLFQKRLALPTYLIANDNQTRKSDPKHVQVTLPSGQVLTFAPNYNSTYYKDAVTVNKKIGSNDVNATLTHLVTSPTVYIVSFSSGVKYIFKGKNSSLAQIIYPSGNSLKFSYTGNNQDGGISKITSELANGNEKIIADRIKLGTSGDFKWVVTGLAGQKDDSTFFKDPETLDGSGLSAITRQVGADMPIYKIRFDDGADTNNYKISFPNGVRADINLEQHSDYPFYSIDTDKGKISSAYKNVSVVSQIAFFKKGDGGAYHQLSTVNYIYSENALEVIFGKWLLQHDFFVDGGDDGSAYDMSYQGGSVIYRGAFNQMLDRHSLTDDCANTFRGQKTTIGSNSDNQITYDYETDYNLLSNQIKSSTSTVIAPSGVSEKMTDSQMIPVVVSEDNTLKMKGQLQYNTYPMCGGNYTNCSDGIAFYNALPENFASPLKTFSTQYDAMGNKLTQSTFYQYDEGNSQKPALIIPEYGNRTLIDYKKYDLSNGMFQYAAVSKTILPVSSANGTITPLKNRVESSGYETISNNEFPIIKLADGSVLKAPLNLVSTGSQSYNGSKELSESHVTYNQNALGYGLPSISKSINDPLDTTPSKGVQGSSKLSIIKAFPYTDNSGETKNIEALAITTTQQGLSDDSEGRAPNSIATKKIVSYATGQLLASYDANGHETTYVYDGLGRVVKETADANSAHPLISTTKYNDTLDSDGYRLIDQTQPVGIDQATGKVKYITIHKTIDPLNRLISVYQFVPSVAIMQPVLKNHYNDLGQLTETDHYNAS